MKRTIFLLLVIATAVICVSVLTTPEQVISKTAGCPFAGCQSTIYLFTDHANCSGVWCGPGGSGGNFTTDGNGDAVFECLCEGTYYFCLLCAENVYAATVNGAPKGFVAQETAIPCPCN